MNIVTTTSVFPIGSDQLQVLDRLATLGYTHLDMAFDYCDTPGSPFLTSDFEAWAKQINYRGDLVLEAHHQSIEAPDEKRDTILSELMSRAKQMASYYESIDAASTAP